MGDLVGEGGDKFSCLWWIQDFDVVSELHELADSVELVVADGYQNGIGVARGLYGLEPAAEDAAGHVLGLRVERCCYVDVVTLFELGDEGFRERFERKV